MTGETNQLISDEVLLLRPMTVADVIAHVAGEDDEQRKWLWNDINLKSTVEGATRYIEQCLEEWRTGAGHRAWGVRELESDVLVGYVDVRDRGDGSVNVAVVIYPDYRGRGYARRAVRMASEFARAAMGLGRVVAIIDSENVASRRAAEGAGFVLEGPAEPWEDSQPTGVMLRYVLKAV